MKHAVRRIGAAVATAALAGGMVVALPGMASAAGPGYHCKNWQTSSHKWTASCTVTSGQARATTECGNGKVIYGKWVGRGQWAFGGECGQYALMAYSVDWKK
ncbi:hypothetical protein [Streptomyces sp. NBC_00354]|uniref:hypothetical protein n=1 Tax=unclassified Streptomyces TaxID=2593676 RepID=UPI002E268497